MFEGREAGRTCVLLEQRSCARNRRGRACEAEQGYKARGESRILAAGLGERGVGGVGHGDKGVVVRARDMSVVLLLKSARGVKFGALRGKESALRAPQLPAGCNVDHFSQKVNTGTLTSVVAVGHIKSKYSFHILFK